MDWILEWPTDPGRYWFYGWRSTFGLRNSKPRMHMVEVRTAGGPDRRFTMYVCDGGFIHQSEGGYGLWLSAVVPDSPQLERPDELGDK